MSIEDSNKKSKLRATTIASIVVAMLALGAIPVLASPVGLPLLGVILTSLAVASFIILLINMPRLIRWRREDRLHNFLRDAKSHGEEILELVSHPSFNLETTQHQESILMRMFTDRIGGTAPAAKKILEVASDDVVISKILPHVKWSQYERNIALDVRIVNRVLLIDSDAALQAILKLSASSDYPEPKEVNALINVIIPRMVWGRGISYRLLEHIFSSKNVDLQSAFVEHMEHGLFTGVRSTLEGRSVFEQMMIHPNAVMLLQNIEGILKKYTTPESLIRDARGDTPLHAIARLGKPEVLEKYFELVKDSCYVPNNAGQYPHEVAGNKALSEMIYADMTQHDTPDKIIRIHDLKINTYEKNYFQLSESVKTTYESLIQATERSADVDEFLSEVVAQLKKVIAARNPITAEVNFWSKLAFRYCGKLTNALVDVFRTVVTQQNLDLFESMYQVAYTQGTEACADKGENALQAVELTATLDAIRKIYSDEIGEDEARVKTLEEWALQGQSDAVRDEVKHIQIERLMAQEEVCFTPQKAASSSMSGDSASAERSSEYDAEIRSSKSSRSSM